MKGHWRISVRAALLLLTATALHACGNGPASTATSAAGGVPEWTGVWITAGAEMGIDGFTPVDPSVLTGPPPPLFIFNPTIPWNDTMRREVGALLSAKEDLMAKEDPNGPRGANGWGYPTMMASPAPIQFAVTPTLTLIFDQYRDLRLVHTDGRGHQPEDEGWPPTTWGDSIGHWDGDTLVIETIGVRGPREYVGVAAPFSEKARYRERLRRVSEDRIEGEMTIEDPATLTAPMKIPLAYVRSKEIDRLMPDAFTNDRTGFDGEFNTIEEAPRH